MVRVKLPVKMAERRQSNRFLGSTSRPTYKQKRDKSDVISLSSNVRFNEDYINYIQLYIMSMYLFTEHNHSNLIG